MNLMIIEYNEECFNQLANLLGTIYGSKISKEVLEKYYLSNNKKIYLAKIDDTIVGCAFLEIKIDYIRPYTYGYITYVAVDENYRKMGIGRTILEHIVTVSKELGCSTVELTSANSRVNAHIFYESLGFTKKKTTVFIKDPL